PRNQSGELAQLQHILAARDTGWSNGTDKRRIGQLQQRENWTRRPHKRIGFELRQLRPKINPLRERCEQTRRQIDGVLVGYLQAVQSLNDHQLGRTLKRIMLGTDSFFLDDEPEIIGRFTVERYKKLPSKVG